MIIAKTITECRTARQAMGRLAFVPTMGALHAGHLSLIELAKRNAERVAVSIFVNPTQFAPSEDLSKYPRPLDDDLRQCQAAGADLVFVPTPAEMYRPAQPRIAIDLPELSGVLEGAARPGHFAGVCQVVAKLFNIVTPQVAVFGRKDFQQLRVIEAMVESLDFPIEIVPGPTVRDADGLAMSSRNIYLSASERQRALSISRGLFRAREAFARGALNTAPLLEIMKSEMVASDLAIDYATAVDARTLSTVAVIEKPTALLIAARVGSTRLIDNLVLPP